MGGMGGIDLGLAVWAALFVGSLCYCMGRWHAHASYRRGWKAAYQAIYGDIATDKRYIRGQAKVRQGATHLYERTEPPAEPSTAPAGFKGRHRNRAPARA